MPKALAIKMTMPRPIVAGLPEIATSTARSSIGHYWILSYERLIRIGGSATGRQRPLVAHGGVGPTWLWHSGAAFRAGLERDPDFSAATWARRPRPLLSRRWAHVDEPGNDPARSSACVNRRAAAGCSAALGNRGNGRRDAASGRHARHGAARSLEKKGCIFVSPASARTCRQTW